MHELIESENGKLIVNSNDSVIGRKLKVEGVWEKYILNEIHSIVKEGDTTIDCGANLGAHTVPLSKAVGPQGEVFAFEPSKVIYRQLMGNLYLNNCLNVEALNNAASDEPNLDIPFNEVNALSPRNFGDIRMGRVGDERSNIVKSKRVDDLKFKSRVSFIKIDCQGFDYKVITGAEATIREHKPTVIIEWEAGMAKYHGHTMDMLKEYISRIDYNIINLKHSDWICTPK